MRSANERHGHHSRAFSQYFYILRQLTPIAESVMWTFDQILICVIFCIGNCRLLSNFELHSFFYFLLLLVYIEQQHLAQINMHMWTIQASVRTVPCMENFCLLFVNCLCIFIDYFSGWGSVEWIDRQWRGRSVRNGLIWQSSFLIYNVSCCMICKINYEEKNYLQNDLAGWRVWYFPLCLKFLICKWPSQ